MKSVLLLLAFVVGTLAHAQVEAQTTTKAYQGLVKLELGYELYVDYSPAEPGQPTIVLINGLVYDLHRWDDYVSNLKNSGAGVLRYYFRGQSLTLLNESQDGKQTPEFFHSGLTYNKLATELSSLVEALHIEGTLNVVGLSYGSAIAAEFANSHPERVDNLILLAPLVVSLDRYDPAGAWIHQNLDAIRFWWGPLWGPQAYDFYYDLIFRSYLVDQRLTPERIPPELRTIADIYKESIFHLVRAVRDFDLKSYRFAKLSRVHLILASEEDAPALRDQYAAWEAWDVGSRASLTMIENSSHAIPDAKPELAAELTLKMISGEKNYRDQGLNLANEDGISHCLTLAALKKRECQ